MVKLERDKVFLYAITKSDGLIEAGFVKSKVADFKTIENVVKLHGGPDEVYHAAIFNPVPDISKPMLRQFQSADALAASVTDGKPYEWVERDTGLIELEGQRVYNIRPRYL